jgi:hypothetical protein
MIVLKNKRRRESAWNELGYVEQLDDFFNRLKYRPEFRDIKDIDSFVKYVKEGLPGVVIKNGWIRPYFENENLWHATEAFKIPDILQGGLRPYNRSHSTYVEPIFEDGVEVGANLPCLFTAQDAGYAAFKSGQTNEPLALIKIDCEALEDMGYIPWAVDSSGNPITQLSPAELVKTSIEKARYGNLEVGLYDSIPADPKIMTGIYVDRRARNGVQHYNGFNVVRVGPVHNWRGWNRAVVGAEAK